ncbi:MAG: hypothetical protein ACTSVY_11760 [Candidatus Helarchaeota archaeon]
MLTTRKRFRVLAFMGIGCLIVLLAVVFGRFLNLNPIDPLFFNRQNM